MNLIGTLTMTSNNECITFHCVIPVGCTVIAKYYWAFVEHQLHPVVTHHFCYMIACTVIWQDWCKTFSHMVAVVDSGTSSLLPRHEPVKLWYVAKENGTPVRQAVSQYGVGNAATSLWLLIGTELLMALVTYQSATKLDTWHITISKTSTAPFKSNKM
jgi:hypothetical protein